jgi:NADH-quinone oxidoreductase subunit M
MYYLTLLFLNLFGIIGACLLPAESKLVLRKFGLWMSVLIFFFSLSFYKLCKVSILKGMFVFMYKTKYIWADLFLFDFQIGMDFLSFFLLILSTFLIPVCIIASWESIQNKWKEFIILLFIMEFFLINVFVVFDVFLFYLFFEGILIPMFLIIGIWGSRERKIHAAYQFFLYTLFGSLLMLIGIIYIYIEKGTGNLIVLYGLDFSWVEQISLWILFFFSFAVKVPMLPLHLWLPEAHVEAPTAGSVLLAGILLKLGGYGMIRFLLSLFPQASLYFQPMVFVIALLSIYYSSLSTIRQIDLKKIIAYSSIGHMNYVVLGLFSNNIEGLVGGYYMMISHGFVSSGLFLCIGFLYERYHSRNLFEYGGLVQVMPLYVSIFFIFIFANFGFPGTSSFIGEFLIVLGLSSVNRIVFILGGFGLIFGTVYNLWLLNRIAFGSLSLKIKENCDMNLRESLLLLMFLILIILLGIFPSLILEKLDLNFQLILYIINEFI